MAGILPTFGETGWVKNPLEILDYLLAYYFETQPSQSHFHKQRIFSFQRTLGDNQDDLPGMKDKLETDLTDYFRTQFDDVKLSIEFVPIDGDQNNNQLVLKIGCNFSFAGQRYSMDHGIELYGVNVKRIWRYNETGELS